MRGETANAAEETALETNAIRQPKVQEIASSNWNKVGRLYGLYVLANPVEGNYLSPF